jgi:hypothetical protein
MAQGGYAAARSEGAAVRKIGRRQATITGADRSSGARAERRRRGLSRAPATGVARLARGATRGLATSFPGLASSAARMTSFTLPDRGRALRSVIQATAGEQQNRDHQPSEPGNGHRDVSAPRIARIRMGRCPSGIERQRDCEGPRQPKVLPSRSASCHGAACSLRCARRGPPRPEHCPGRGPDAEWRAWHVSRRARGLDRPPTVEAATRLQSGRHTQCMSGDPRSGGDHHYPFGGRAPKPRISGIGSRLLHHVGLFAAPCRSKRHTRNRRAHIREPNLAGNIQSG